MWNGDVGEMLTRSRTKEARPALLAADRLDPLTLYVTGLDTSDYVEKVVPLIRTTIGATGSLLDIGAGGGHLGAMLRSPDHLWSVIEPDRGMQRRLRRHLPSPVLIASGWREARPSARGHDTVLAANMPAPVEDGPDFLDYCRLAAARRVVWVVAAQRGPRRICLADCVPSDWHGQDETPSVDLVFDRLPARDHPRNMRKIDWTFRIEVPSLQLIAEYLADQLGWDLRDERLPELRERIARQAVATPGGFRIDSPRSSAVLVW